MRHLALGLLLILALSCPASAQQSGRASGNGSDEAYQYPVRPGMPEWADLTTADERVEATQVPDDVLSRMSTKALAQTCLNYPLLLHITAYNSYQDGIENLLKFSNAHWELFRRSDAGPALIGAYEALQPMNAGWAQARQGEHQFRYFAAELLLAQDRMLATMTRVDKIHLLEVALAKHDAKASVLEYYGAMGLESSAYLLARVCIDMDRAAFTPLADDDVQRLLSTGTTQGRETVTKVVTFAKNYDREIKRGVE